MKWIDSHCHLDFDVFADDKQLAKKMVASGCQGILIPATTADKFEHLFEFKQAFNSEFSGFICLALGLHPYFGDQHKPEHLIKLEELLASEQIMAVGEIGLDYLLPAQTHERQKGYFEQQVLLAKKYQLPLVVHCRKAHDQINAILRRLNFNTGGIIHAFSGSVQQAQAYLKLGFVLGLGGALTFERAHAMHKMVKLLPDNAFVLETDSPDMAPAFAKSKINTPLNTPKIAQYIADLRGQSLQDIYLNSTENFKRVMGLYN